MFLYLLFGLFCSLGLQAQQRESREVYFEYNSAELTATAQKSLSAAIAFCLGRNRVKRIEINGHADTSGSAAYNMELSDKRAEAVRNYLLAHGLASQQPKILVNFYGEKQSRGKTAERQRAVVLNIYFALPDRDTVLRFGCVSIKIPANSFENFNLNELELGVTYAGDAKAAKDNQLVMQDSEGNTLLSNGMVRLDVKYKGRAIKAQKPIEYTLPELNNRGEFAIYNGYMENGVVKWKKTDEKVERVGGSGSGNCNSFYKFSSSEVNNWKNIDKVDACICSSDGFGGMAVPKPESMNLLSGERGSLLFTKDGKGNMQAEQGGKKQFRDLMTKDEVMNYCNQLANPNFFPLPVYPRKTIEPIAFFEVQHITPSSLTDEFTGNSANHFVAIPLSEIGNTENVAIITGEKRNGSFQKWNSYIHKEQKCLGSINCDYMVFDVPLDGYFALVRVEYDGAKKKTKAKEQRKETPVSIKVRKHTSAVVVVADAKTRNITGTRVNKGDRSATYQTNFYVKNEMAGKIIVVKEVRDKHIYGYIKLADDMPFRKGKKRYVVRRMKKYTEAEWEAAVKKYCSGG